MESNSLNDLPSSSITQFSSQAPKWLVILFKILGAILLFSAIVGGPIFLVISAITNPKTLFSSTSFSMYGLIITSTVLGFGYWELKKWILPILGLSLINGIIYMVLAGVNFPGIIIGIVIFAVAYFYRQYFTGSYRSYAPYIVFVIGSAFLYVNIFLRD